MITGRAKLFHLGNTAAYLLDPCVVFTLFRFATSLYHTEAFFYPATSPRLMFPQSEMLVLRNVQALRGVLQLTIIHLLIKIEAFLYTCVFG